MTMRQLLTTLATCITAATAGLLVVTSPASQGAVAARATTSGEVGAFTFHDKKRAPGAACVYKDGRLTAINLKAPSAAGRQEWEPTGQYILWSARLQAKVGRGAWRFVGGAHYSEAVVGHAGQLNALPPTSIPRVFGDPDTRYRVVETINWYFNDRNKPIVQGQASTLVRHYKSQRRQTSNCEGVTGTRLPPLGLITNEELDKVKVSFAGRSHGAEVKYSIKRGRLPKGLSLKARNGVVTGMIPASAVNTTVTYHDIKRRTFNFTVAAKANGRTTTKSYRWAVYDTAFLMPNYYGFYGCGTECAGEPESIPNISNLGPKIAFGCTTQPQSGIPADKYSVIYRQDYQKNDGSLAPSAGLIFRYGDVFKWWYYEASC